jgi:hypothetical protein
MQAAYGFLHIDEDALFNHLTRPTEGLDFAQACKEVYLHSKPLTEKGNIQLIGDKNPHYSLFIPRLRRTFPEARFIHIIRDPRANVQSMLGVDFESHCPASLSWRWKYYNRKIEIAKSKQPGSFFTITYEKLAAEPRSVIMQICEFLGIDFCEDMLEFHTNKALAEKRFPKDALERYHQNLFEPISTSRTELWKESLTQRQIRTVEAVCGTFARRYGYERSTTGKLTGSRLFALPGMAYGFLYMVWGDLLNLFPYGIRMFVIRSLAVIFRPWWKRYGQ